MGVLAHMYHLRAGVGLLVVIGDGNAIELCRAVVALQDAARVLPRHRATRLHLCPGDLAARPFADAAFGNKVIDTALALLVAGIPVLHSAVLHLGILQCDDFHNSGMQLVLVALRSCAAFHIAHVCLFVGNDERAFKLTRTLGVDAEIARQLDGATHPLGDIAERPVAEHGRIQSSKEIVAARHNRPKVLFHNVGIFLHCLADGAEQDTLVLQHLLRSGLHRHRVHDGVVCHTCQLLLLPQGDTQLVEGGKQLRVHLVKALFQLFLLGSRIIDNILVVHLVILQMTPVGLLHGLPLAESVQAELQQPFRLVLFLRYEAYHIFVKALADGVCLDIGDKTPFILLVGNLLYDTIIVFCHSNDYSFCLGCKDTKKNHDNGI